MKEQEAISVGVEAVDDGYDFDECAEKTAKRVGCVIVYPAENQLQIDIDSKDDLKYFKKRLNEFVKLWRVHGIILKKQIIKSKSGGDHYHIYLTLFEDAEDWQNGEIIQTPYCVSETERILYQFALGSDKIRETLNTMRLITGTPRPTRLFELKRVIS